MGFNNAFIYIFIYVPLPSRAPLWTAKAVWVLSEPGFIVVAQAVLFCTQVPAETGVSVSVRESWRAVEVGLWFHRFLGGPRSGGRAPMLAELCSVEALKDNEQMISFLRSARCWEASARWDVLASKGGRRDFCDICTQPSRLFIPPPSASLADGSRHFYSWGSARHAFMMI